MVLSNGLELLCSKSSPGPVSDVAILTIHAKKGKDLLQKSIASTGLVDHGEQAQCCPDSWALLCEKGYIEALEFCVLFFPIIILQIVAQLYRKKPKVILLQVIGA